MSDDRRVKAHFWTHYEWGHVIISGDRFYLNWYTKGPPCVSPSLCLILWRWRPTGPLGIYLSNFGFDFGPWSAQKEIEWAGVRLGRFYLRTFWLRRKARRP